MSKGDNTGWTKTPNEIYTAMPTMEETELRITLVLVRHTYGYQRDGCELTYADFHRETGMGSPSSIRKGVKEVIKRGFFTKGNSRSAWIVVQKTTDNVGSKDEETTPTVVTTGNVDSKPTGSVEENYTSCSENNTLTVVPTSGPKESGKENYKEKNTPLYPPNGNGVGVEEVELPESDYRLVVKVYEQEIGMITMHVSERIEVALEEFSAAALVEAIKLASENNVRRWSYVDGILGRWRTEGRGKLPAPPKRISILDENGRPIKEVTV